jgi:hypothetical protein
MSSLPEQRKSALEETLPKMNNQAEQQKLLEIVETWNLNEKPEYRGFRCANCQGYKNEANYHFLNFGGYRLPIHMCEDGCEQALQLEQIEIDPSRKVVVNKDTFGKKYQYAPEAIERFKQIVASWPEYQKPELKAFLCDDCGDDLEIDHADGQRKGFHSWWNNDGTLVELHFHRECGNKLGIE